MFDPSDYDGVTDASERRERDEARELRAQEAEERTAREMAFSDTHFCDDACFETLEHSAACQALNAPLAALAGWRRAQSIAIQTLNAGAMGDLSLDKLNSTATSVVSEAA